MALVASPWFERRGLRDDVSTRGSRNEHVPQLRTIERLALLATAGRDGEGPRGRHFDDAQKPSAAFGAADTKHTAPSWWKAVGRTDDDISIRWPAQTHADVVDAAAPVRPTPPLMAGGTLNGGPAGTEDEHVPGRLVLHVPQTSRHEVLPTAVWPGVAREAPPDLGPSTSVLGDRTASGSASFVEQLFARASQPEPPELVSVRIVQAPSAPSGATGSGPVESPAPVSAPVAGAGLHARLSRGEIDQLVDRVTRIIKRRERFDRESRGIL